MSLLMRRRVNYARNIQANIAHFMNLNIGIIPLIKNIHGSGTSSLDRFLLPLLPLYSKYKLNFLILEMVFVVHIRIDVQNSYSIDKGC